MRAYIDMGIKWTFSDPDAAVWGCCVVCGAPRLQVAADIPNHKTGTYDHTRSLQCSVEHGHKQV